MGINFPRLALLSSKVKVWTPVAIESDGLLRESELIPQPFGCRLEANYGCDEHS